MATLVEVWAPTALLRHGVIGGVVAGTVLAVEEIVATLVLGGIAIDPFRLVASVVLGRQALSPDFAVWLSLLVGTGAHLVLSVVFGFAFLLLVAGAYQLSARTPLLLIYGVLYGLALWELNILTVLHLMFPQVAPLFELANQVWNGIVAYAIFYGLVLGAYVAFTRPGVVANWKR